MTWDDFVPSVSERKQAKFSLRAQPGRTVVKAAIERDGFAGARSPA